MVFRVRKLILLAASCCIELVVYGSGEFLRRSFFSTLSTSKSGPDNRDITSITSSLLFSARFLPSTPQKAALNFLAPFLNSPSIDQYS